MGYGSPEWTFVSALIVAEFGSWICIASIAGFAVWRPRQAIYLLGLLMMAGVVSLLSRALSEWLAFPRPFALGLSPSYTSHGNRGGLPSTHAAALGVVAIGFLIRPALRDLGAWIASLALLICLSRVYIGLHFPLDILAGLGLSVFCIILSKFFYHAVSRVLHGARRRTTSSP